MARKLARLLLVPLALLCVGVMRLLNRLGIVTIRIGVHYPPRIGHTVMHTELYLCERDAGKHPAKTLDIWTVKDRWANSYYGHMIQRELLHDPTRFAGLVDICNKLFDGWEKHAIAGPTQFDRDIYNLMELFEPHLRMRYREQLRGSRELERLGIQHDAPIVCLMVRDAAFLPGLAYHSFRDADIDTYEQAALALAKRGYWVMRMGAKVAKPFSVNYPKIFDYATSKMRSEFMDIYLAWRCKFAISTSTGWDALPQVFRKPICYTNFPQWEYLPTWQPKSLAIWKHHEKAGRRMAIAEIIESKIGQVMRAEELKAAGITLVDNTAEEITASVLEMVEWVEGRWCPWEQTGFWERYPKNNSAFNGLPLHGEMRLRIGQEFLLEAESVQRQENTRDDPSARRLEARTA